MACVRRDFEVEAPVDDVWAALRDIGNVHRRLLPDVFADVELHGGERVVTFVGGTTVREVILDLDDRERRLAFALVEGPAWLRFYHASIKAFADGAHRTLVMSTFDVLPHERAEPIAKVVDEAIASVQRSLEHRYRWAPVSLPFRLSSRLRTT